MLASLSLFAVSLKNFTIHLGESESEKANYAFVLWIYLPLRLQETALWNPRVPRPHSGHCCYPEASRWYPQRRSQSVQASWWCELSSSVLSLVCSPKHVTNTASKAWLPNFSQQVSSLAPKPGGWPFCLPASLRDKSLQYTQQRPKSSCWPAPSPSSPCLFRFQCSFLSLLVSELMFLFTLQRVLVYSLLSIIPGTP